jgi:quercetin dioxygenase-like cupin family protein
MFRQVRFTERRTRRFPVNEQASGSEQFNAAKANRLVGLIDIAPGTVASRTLVKGASGTLTLFGFDAGEGLSEHSAPFDAWVHVLEGSVRLTIGGKPVEAAAGDIVCMPANVPHALHAIERMKMLLILYK